MTAGMDSCGLGDPVPDGVATHKDDTTVEGGWKTVKDKSVCKAEQDSKSVIEFGLKPIVDDQGTRALAVNCTNTTARVKSIVRTETGFATTTSRRSTCSCGVFLGRRR